MKLSLILLTLLCFVKCNVQKLENYTPKDVKIKDSQQISKQELQLPFTIIKSLELQRQSVYFPINVDKEYEVRINYPAIVSWLCFTKCRHLATLI
jgi:hypothetical protein